MISSRTMMYCCEDISRIENYALALADESQVWHCHHRAEILPCGRYSIKELKAAGLYWNRPASELILLTKADHTRLHNLHMRDDSRKKIARTKTGKNRNRQDTSKSVRMTRLSDGFSKVFASQKEAGRWLIANGFQNADYRLVSKVCHEKRKTAYGASWSYVN